MRKETTNTWSEGLVMDLNPINTPNSVLTDCVNGTIITYDGNEHSLQNDKGNYPLANCKLNKNFIPVGMREYGDILYIVSYNPLTEETEIGSYPSPQTIESSAQNTEIAMESIQTAMKTTTINYSDIIENYQEMKVFYGKDPNKLKINPGDQYRLTNWITTLPNSSKYETLKFYILDENRKTYDVTDKVKEAAASKTDFSYVEWDVPGWLALQPIFAEIDKVALNVNQFVVPAYGGSPTLIVSVQLTISDQLILNSSTEDLWVKLTIGDNEHSIDAHISNSNRVNLRNGEYNYYSSTIELSNYIQKGQEKLKVKIEPYIKYTTSGTTYTIMYDNLIKEEEFSLSAVGSIETIKIGENSFWYNLGDSTFDLMFDTQGISKNAALSSELYLYYSFSKLSDQSKYATDASGTEYKHVRCEGWNLIGETTISIPLVSYTEENKTKVPQAFFPEDFYILKIELSDSSTWNDSSTPLRTINKFIVASKLMSDFKDAKYDEITYDRWFGKYIDSIQNKQLKLNSNNQGEVSYGELKASDGYNSWMSNKCRKSAKAKSSGIEYYKTFVEDEDLETVQKGIQVYCEATCTADIEAASEVTLLAGPMWDNLIENAKCQMEINNIQKEVKFSSITGKLTGSETFTGVTVQGSKIRTYPLSLELSNETIYSYEAKDIPFTILKLTVTGNASSTSIVEFITYKKKAEVSLSLNPKKISAYSYSEESSGSNTYKEDQTPFFSALKDTFSTTPIYWVEAKLSSVSGKNVKTTNIGIGVESKSGSQAEDEYYAWKAAGTSDDIYACFLCVQDGQNPGFINVCNHSNRPEHDPNAAKATFDEWFKNAHKISTDDTWESTFNAYTVKTEDVESFDKIVDTAVIQGKSTLVFNTFQYAGKNMLNVTERASLYNASNLLIGKGSDSDYTTLSDVEINAKEANIKVVLDFSKKDEAFAKNKEIVEKRNELVKKEIEIYGTDIYQDKRKPSALPTFYYGDDISTEDPIIKILEAGKLPTTSSSGAKQPENLYAEDYLVSVGNSSSLCVRKVLGTINSETTLQAKQ